ncbi:MAG: DUF4178 domain-containing protein [Flammeovirgaceae bacterium]
MSNSLIVRQSDLTDVPFAVQAQLAELPSEAQQDFIYEFTRRKKEVPIAYIAHFTTLSEGYLDNWTLQLLFWFSFVIGVGPFWWFINLFRMPGKVSRFNKKLATKVLKHIHYKYKITGKGKLSSLKGKTFQNPSSFLKKSEYPGPRKLEPLDPYSITLESLKLGFLVDYQTETFETVNEFQYDWEDGSSEKLFKMRDMGGIDSFFLMIQREGSSLMVYKVQPVNIFALKEDLDREIAEFKRPSNIIRYQDVAYFREYSKTGLNFNMEKTNMKMPPQEVIAWKYFDDIRKRIIRVEKHGENDFKAFVGEAVPQVQFNNVMPNQ